MSHTDIVSLLDRFWSKVEVGLCWTWLGTPSSNGYGRFGKRARYAHRLVWEALVGPIPGGLELDHLCRNTMCVNPDHLEPVTHRENMRRGKPSGILNVADVLRQRTHCNREHPFDGDNLGSFKNGKDQMYRRCRACAAENARAYRRRKREEVTSA